MRHGSPPVPDDRRGGVDVLSARQGDLFAALGGAALVAAIVLVPFTAAWISWSLIGLALLSLAVRFLRRRG